MIKNEKGITLVALVITIAVLMIIALISIDLGKETIVQVENKKITTELSTVQQAIFQQYTLLESYGYDGIIPEEVTENVIMREDVNRPELLLGVRIVNLETLEDYDFTDYKKEYTSTMSFEEFYYIIDEDDLKELGVNKEEDNEDIFSYIVNYSTGEVFDVVHKKYINEYDSTLREENASITGAGNTFKIEEEQYNFTD